MMHKKYCDKVVGNILGQGYKKRKVEIEKEGRDIEVEWEEDD